MLNYEKLSLFPLVRFGSVPQGIVLGPFFMKLKIKKTLSVFLDPAIDHRNIFEELSGR